MDAASVVFLLALVGVGVACAGARVCGWNEWSIAGLGLNVGVLAVCTAVLMGV